MLNIQNLRAGYEKTIIIEDIHITIEPNTLTAIVGANGCGKSTLFKALSSGAKMFDGVVTIDGIDKSSLRMNDIAKRMSILPQHPISPEGITVETLVGYGRTPYQNLLGMKTPNDHHMIEQALEATDLFGMRHNLVANLSGGQRQRAWIAMILAQDTDLILLDEPTNHLDLRYQHDILKLLKALNKQGKTIVIIMHDLNQAAQYADTIYMMHEGRIYQSGSPNETMNSAAIEYVFGVKNKVIENPETQKRLCVVL